MSNSGESIDDHIYQDEEVLRYDADPYRAKYGDKWKKLATCVRDVPQEDGSIIREYVIEDPSLLDDLSEQEDESYMKINIASSKSNINSENTKFLKESPVFKESTKKNLTSNDEIKKTSSSKKENKTPSPVKTASPNSTNLNKSHPVFAKDNTQISKFNSNSALPSTVTIKKINRNTNDKDYQEVGQSSYFKQNLKSISREVSDNLVGHEDKKLVNLVKNKKLSINEDDFDKEIQNIQESHKNAQRELLEENQKEQSDTLVEYEVVDEHGNFVKLDDAEQFKKLATYIKETKESDGSIVKEYVLNDPKLIEQVKAQLKEKEVINSNGTKLEVKNTIPASFSAATSASTSSASLTTQQQQPLQRSYKHVNSNAIKQSASINTDDEFLKPQQVNESELRQIDFNKYEIVTSSGKTLQFIITEGNASSSDAKEIKNIIEKKILANQSPLIKTEATTKKQNLGNNFIEKNLISQQNLKPLIKSCDFLNTLSDETQSAFINYKNLNNHSQASLAKLKNYENASANNYKRSMSLGNLDDRHTDTEDDDNENEGTTRNNEVTPEMTEQLILKLLLRQLALDQNNNKTTTTTTNIPVHHQQAYQPKHYYQMPSANNNGNRVYDTKVQTIETPQKQQYLTNNNQYMPQIPLRTYYTPTQIANSNYYQVPLLSSRTINNINNNSPFTNIRYNNYYRK